MLANVLTKSLGLTRQNVLHKTLQKFYGIYEPDYLQLKKSKFPLYPPLLIQIRGYDYPIIESYQSWVAKIIRIMNFQILDSFAMPSQDTNVKRYKPKSTEVHIEYILKMYERIFKVSNVTSIGLPVLIRVLEAGLPEGVLLDIKEYKAEDVKHRYIPDKQLLELKKEYEKSK